MEEMVNNQGIRDDVSSNSDTNISSDTREAHPSAAANTNTNSHERVDDGGTPDSQDGMENSNDAGYDTTADGDDTTNDEPAAAPIARCGVCEIPLKKPTSHYGGITCLSCRAFFRRGIQKGVSTMCLRGGTCSVRGNSRKICSNCRMRKCFENGMSENKILSEDQKQVRFRKLHAKKANSQTQQSSAAITSHIGTADQRPENPLELSSENSSVLDLSVENSMSIGLNSENSISIGLISSEKPKINRLSSENSIGFGFGSSENSMNAMQCLPSTSKTAQYKSSFSNTFLNSSENSCFTDNTSSSVQSMPGSNKHPSTGISIPPSNHQRILGARTRYISESSVSHSQDFDHFRSLHMYNGPPVGGTSFLNIGNKFRNTSWSNNCDTTRENEKVDKGTILYPRNNFSEISSSDSSQPLNLGNYYTTENYMNATPERTYQKLHSQISTNSHKKGYFSSISSTDRSNKSTCSTPEKSRNVYIPLRNFSENSSTFHKDNSLGVPQGDILGANIMNDDAQMEAIDTSKSADGYAQAQGNKVSVIMFGTFGDVKTTQSLPPIKTKKMRAAQFSDINKSTAGADRKSNDDEERTENTEYQTVMEIALKSDATHINEYLSTEELNFLGHWNYEFWRVFKSVSLGEAAIRGLNEAREKKFISPELILTVLAAQNARLSRYCFTLMLKELDDHDKKQLARGPLVVSSFSVGLWSALFNSHIQAYMILGEKDEEIGKEIDFQMYPNDKVSDALPLQNDFRLQHQEINSSIKTLHLIKDHKILSILVPLILTQIPDSSSYHQVDKILDVHKTCKSLLRRYFLYTKKDVNTADEAYTQANQFIVKCQKMVNLMAALVMQ